MTGEDKVGTPRLRRVLEGSVAQEKYGFHYFDRPEEDGEEEDDGDLGGDGFEARSCPANCCDKDCECDDCLRCSEAAFSDEEDSLVFHAAAG